ncbi:glyoxalase [Streptomyces fagopyri]|uniref:glyoxalase n=1 Tax=Streptomyces fagopyri TaxID=2662397 RepID=UPI003403F0AF
MVQFTPPGSSCSILFGTGVSSAAPGSAQFLNLVVKDIHEARAELLGGGAEVSEVFHDGSGGVPPGPRAVSLDRTPDAATTCPFASFGGPVGNGWVLQEITKRCPGR